MAGDDWAELDWPQPEDAGRPIVIRIDSGEKLATLILAGMDPGEDAEIPRWIARTSYGRDVPLETADAWTWVGFG